jgi:hypothetical protein
VSGDVRRGFLEVVANGEQGLSGYLGHLMLDQALLNDLFPAVEGLGNGVVRFSGAVFSGDVDFGTRVFRVPVSFDDSRFEGEVSFAGATFEKRVSFAAAVFSGSAKFGMQIAHAEQSAWLTSTTATFVDDADFTGAEFFDDALFEGVRLGGSLRLDRTGFHRECRFDVDQYWVSEELAAEWQVSGRVPGPERTISLRDTRFRDGAITDVVLWHASTIEEVVREAQRLTGFIHRIERRDGAVWVTFDPVEVITYPEGDRIERSFEQQVIDYPVLPDAEVLGGPILGGGASQTLTVDDLLASDRVDRDGPPFMITIQQRNGVDVVVRINEQNLS